jgi:uncharacterized protein YndB with AHSA1/START domain
MATAIQGIKPVVNTEAKPGTVQVDVAVPATVDRVWAALTKHEEVGKWFGDLSQDIVPGAKVRLDFGDADFFAIEDIACQPPDHLRYCWRFLGTGPKDEITWDISYLHDRAHVTVTDFEPSRSKEGVEELSRGWFDFLERLQRFLATGEISRYDWRRDFDGSIELPVPAENAATVLFARDMQEEWVPFGSPTPTNPKARQKTVRNSSVEGLVADVEWNGCCEVDCQFRAHQWLNSTTCRVKIVSNATGSILTVHHTGWAEISNDPSYCMQQRRAFGELWILALQQAKKLVQAAFAS